MLAQTPPTEKNPWGLRVRKTLTSSPSKSPPIPPTIDPAASSRYSSDSFEAASPSPVPSPAAAAPLQLPPSPLPPSLCPAQDPPGAVVPSVGVLAALSPGFDGKISPFFPPPSCEGAVSRPGAVATCWSLQLRAACSSDGTAAAALVASPASGDDELERSCCSHRACSCYKTRGGGTLRLVAVGGGGAILVIKPSVRWTWCTRVYCLRQHSKTKSHANKQRT